MPEGAPCADAPSQCCAGLACNECSDFLDDWSCVPAELASCPDESESESESGSESESSTGDPSTGTSSTGDTSTTDDTDTETTGRQCLPDGEMGCDELPCCDGLECMFFEVYYCGRPE